MAKVQSYKELLVWQKAIELSVKVYTISTNFPKEEVFGLTSQVRRASNSISLNIAEGFGRHTTKSFISFLANALGSLNEVESGFILASKLNFISTTALKELEQQIEELMKMLHALIRSLENKIKETHTDN